ncbi:MAG: septum formation protein Maf [Oscillospiraceae bacterium]|nr:septum formation protein Maf [Oscillospiraceae bacterium]
MTKIVLASASPRRRELLQMLGVRNLEIVPARGGEHPNPELAPAELVTDLSRCKAREVALLRSPEELVIAADTVVVLDGAILGKPRDRTDAQRMLTALSGRSHSVYTGFTLILGEREESAAERSLVFFRPLSPEEIARYIDTGEPMDKAGSYGVQGIGSLFVERIEGDFFNVMGLPLCALGKALRRFGVELI